MVRVGRFPFHGVVDIAVVIFLVFVRQGGGRRIVSGGVGVGVGVGV